jgi:hypothetical protein
MTEPLPKKVFRRDVCLGLALSHATVATLVGLPNNRESEQINLSKLAKALHADPAWILDCIEGRDHAVSQLQATAIAVGVPRVQPRARLRKGVRYSARDLGILIPAISPLAGHPDSNILGPCGWESES